MAGRYTLVGQYTSASDSEIGRVSRTLVRGHGSQSGVLATAVCDCREPVASVKFSGIAGSKGLKGQSPLPVSPYQSKLAKPTKKASPKEKRPM